MRFLADENLSRGMVNVLRERGHEVAWVRTDSPGSSDEQVLARASSENRILVTADKDFGELAFRRGMPAAAGIVLLRIRGSAQAREATFAAAIDARSDWAEHFAVIEDDRVRMTPLPSFD